MNSTIRPSSDDYSKVIQHFYKQLTKSRFPLKQGYLWTHYKDSVHKSEIKECNVIKYWSVSGDKFGLPPELSLMLKNDRKFIRFEYSSRDIYYDVANKNIKGLRTPAVETTRHPLWLEDTTALWECNDFSYEVKLKETLQDLTQDEIIRWTKLSLDDIKEPMNFNYKYLKFL